MHNMNAAAFFQKIESSETYQVESAKVEFALEVKRLMDQQNLTNAQFAALLGVSRPMVSKLLSGDANVTIETMAKAANCLGSRVFIKFVRKDAVARLFEIANCSEQVRRIDHQKMAQTRNLGFSNVQSWDLSANEALTNEIESLAA